MNKYSDKKTITEHYGELSVDGDGGQGGAAPSTPHVKTVSGNCDFWYLSDPIAPFKYFVFLMKDIDVDFEVGYSQQDYNSEQLDDGTYLVTYTNEPFMCLLDFDINTYAEGRGCGVHIYVKKYCDEYVAILKKQEEENSMPEVKNHVEGKVINMTLIKKSE